MPLTVVRAKSVRAAAAVLGQGARFLAGGTLLIRNINAGSDGASRLVLSDGLGLDQITIANGRAEIGAAVTMLQIARHPALQSLKPVAQSIGGPAVRAMATVGGNFFAPYPYGDFAVALMALGAEVTIEDSQRSDVLDLEALLQQRDSFASRIVKSVSFDLPPPGSFRFTKAVRKHPHGASVLSIAALLSVADGMLKGTRVAYGAMAPTPMRSRAVERVLEGKQLDADNIAAAVAIATEGCAPLSDPQASGWYRLKVLPVHLKRLLEGET